MPRTTQQDRQPPFEQAAGAPPKKTDPDALSRLLEDWMRGDEVEQRETFEILRRGLDEDRPDGYKLFP